jgi:hypothetical protein
MTRASSRTIAWGPVSGIAASRTRRAASISLICSLTTQRRAMSRRSSARQGLVLGCAQRDEALGGPTQRWLETPHAEAGQAALHPVHDPRALNHRGLVLAVRPLGILSLKRRDRRHAAVVGFAPQPAKTHALEQARIETVRLRPPVLARHGDARRMDDLRLNAPCPQPARQPEAFAAGFVGDGDPRDPASRLGRLVLPAPQQGEQRGRVRAPTSSMDDAQRRGQFQRPANSTGSSLTTATMVLFCSKAVQHRLRSLGWGMRRSITCCQRRWCPSPRRLPLTIFNRRTARSIVHRFARVIQQAVLTPPATYRDIVTGPAT